MALNPHTALASRNAALNTVFDQLNSGFIKIYDGTQPANADTAVTTQNMLVMCTFGATAYGAASAGVKTANAITAGTVAIAGTATWARLLKSDGTTVVHDCSVGLSGTDIVMADVALTVGGLVPISSLTHTMAA